MTDIHWRFDHPSISTDVSGRKKPRGRIVLPTNARVNPRCGRVCSTTTSSSSPQRRHHATLSDRIRRLTHTRTIPSSSTDARRALLSALYRNGCSYRCNSPLNWYARAR